ncbi:MAG: DNA-directed RNA polymerase subunit K [Nanoarchaeota archaeon]
MTEQKFSKYEIARIIGARALQISMGAPLLIQMGESDFERINYSPIEIANIEFKAGILPITVKRPLP